MRERRLALSIICGVVLTMTLLVSPVGARAQALQAYVPSDFADTTTIVARLEAAGWTVTTAHTLDLGGQDPYAVFDLIWIVPDASTEAFAYLRDPIAELAVFAEDGGVLIITGVGGDAPGLDIGPGGLDVMGLPADGAGAVTIAAADHPLVTGVDTGGVALTDSDLDPEATGGAGYLTNLPSGATTTTTIAQNTAGAVFLNYDEGLDSDAGDGHILVSSLVNPSADAIDNIILYVASLIP